MASKLSIIEKLCYSSIKAGIGRLSDIRTWPRPSAARRLKVGYDFYRDQMKDIQDVNNFLEYLAADGDIRSIYFAQPGMSADHISVLYEFWELLLLRMLPEIESMEPSKRVFQKWFRRFYKELYSPTAIWRIIDTVTGLNLHGKVLNFDEATALISRPAYDLGRDIWGPYEYPVEGQGIPENWSAVGSDNAVIVTTVRIPKSQYAGSYMPYPHLTMDVERSMAVIDAIRLVKSGAPRRHCHAEFQVSHFPLSTRFAYCQHKGSRNPYESEAVLDKRDYFHVRNIWRELMNTKYKDMWPTHHKLSPFDVAFAGFSRSYEMRSWLDNIVDLTIALESLFGPKDNQELRHRISLRAAWLLSEDDREKPARLRDRIYDYVRTMYDIRSCRVHGDIPKDTKIRKWVQTLSGAQYARHDTTEEIRLIGLALESAREIVRKALLACMKLQELDPGGPHWPLPDDFDQNIVILGRRKVWQEAAGIAR